MNAVVAWLLAAESDGPIGLLTRLTLLLALAWLMHTALARANPRWRVLLWRGSAAAMLVLVALSLAGPTIPLALLPPVAEPGLTVAPPPAIQTPTPDRAPLANGTPNLATAVGQHPADIGSLETDKPVAAAAEIPAADRPWATATLLWAVWIFGLVVGLLGETIAGVRIARLRRRAHAAEAAIAAQAGHIAQRLGVAKPLEILITRELETPCVVGLWRPAILLPSGSSRPDGDDLPSVLAHEIQHLKNADLAWNAILRGLARLLWFHPLAWRMRLAHVSACDAVCDAVAANFTGDVSAYCRTLARLALRAHTPASAVGLAMAKRSSVRRRIESLERGVDAARLSRRAASIAVVVGLSAAGLLGTTALTRAESPASDKPGKTTEEKQATADSPPLPKIDLPPANPAPPPADAQPTRSFDGTVTDTDGKAVAGADVWFNTVWTSGPLQELLLAGRADDEGRFRFSVPEAWLSEKRGCVIWASAPSHTAGVTVARNPLEGKARDEPCVVQLPPASDLSVVVTLPDGKPAVAAKVAPLIYQYDGASIVEVPWMVAEKIGGVTDQQGRAKLPALARNRVLNTGVVHPGHGRQDFFIQLNQRREHWDRTEERRVLGEPELRLRPAGRIEGRLIANQPELVRGIPIKIETRQPRAQSVQNRAAAAYDHLPAWGTAETTTDAEGRFVIPEIAEGTMGLTIDVDRRLPIRPRIPDLGDLELTGADPIQLEIPLEMCVRVHGLVRVKDGGAPLESHVILEWGPRQFELAATDENGNYSAFVLPGDLKVSANFGRQYIDAAGQWGKTCAVPKGVTDFELPPIEAVPAIDATGTLLDSEGKPLAGARVGGIAGNTMYGWNKSDEQGVFSLGQFPTRMRFDSFSIESGGERFDGKIESTDPLVVSLQIKAAEAKEKGKQQ